MTDLSFEPVPFITRKMLAFEHALVLKLRITTQSSVQTDLTVRGITREGIFTFKVTTVTDSFEHSVDFQVPDIPIWLTVIDTATTTLQGLIFVKADLLANGDQVLQMAAGFINGSKALQW